VNCDDMCRAQAACKHVEPLGFLSYDAEISAPCSAALGDVCSMRLCQHISLARSQHHTGWQCSPPTPVRCRSNKQQYCEQHGYAFIDASSLLDGTWHHITLPVAAVPLHLAHPRLDMHAGINISQV
jgi:hypothetical protein